MEGIQSLIGYKRTHEATEEKYVIKLQQRIEDLTELLDNYDLEIIEYNGDNMNLFEENISPNVQQPQMVVPAVVKGENAVLKGKVFVPET